MNAAKRASLIKFLTSGSKKEHCNLAELATAATAAKSAGIASRLIVMAALGGPVAQLAGILGPEAVSEALHTMSLVISDPTEGKPN